MMESTEDLVWAVDLEYRLLTFNRAFQQSFLKFRGIEAVPGRPATEGLPPEQAAPRIGYYERALASGPFKVEQTLLDGRTLDLSFNPIVVEGRPAGVSVFGKDISAQKSFESALRAAEEKYREIFDGAQLGMWRTSVEGQPLTVNQALARNLGYESPEQMLAEVTDMGTQVWQRPADRLAFMRQLAAHGKVRGLECHLKRRDGSSFWASLYGRRVTGPDGRPIYFEGHITDITKERNAREALRAAEEKYRLLFQGAMEGMFQVAPDGKPLTANPALARILGYESPEEFLTLDNVGRQVYANPRDREFLLQQLQIHGELRGFECQLRRKDGSLIWVLLSVRATLRGDGGILYTEGFIEDVTERRQAVDALADREQMFRQFFEANGSVMLLIDPADGTITDANFAAASYYGHSRQQLMGMKIGEINTLPAGQLSGEWHKAFLQERKYFNFQHRLATGEQRDVEVYSTPIKAVGRALLFSIVHDTTERNRFAAQLAANEERFRKFFEDNGSVMLLVNPSNGVIESGNKAAAAFYGYTQETLSGMPISRINLMSEEQLAAGLQEAYGKGQMYFLRRHRLASGEVRDVEVYSTPTVVDGRPMGISIIHDVTSRREAEARLIDSEERYRATFEQAAIGILHTSTTGRFLRCNARFAQIVGYTQEEVTELTFRNITHPDDLAGSEGFLEKLMAAPDEIRTWGKRYVRSDGSLTWVNLTSSAQRDHDGNILHFITLVDEINERKLAEEKLAASQLALQASERRYRAAFQTSETRYRTAFDLSLDPIGISRLSDGTYMEINQAFLNLFQYERAEVIGRTSSELQIFSESSERERLANLLRAHSSLRDISVKLRKKTGEVFPVLMSASLVELDGEQMLLATARDITHALAAEDQINDLTNYDALTRLPNRRLLMDRLRQAQVSGVRGGLKQALLLLDLDDFKTLNEAMGHPTGDRLIQEVATRLSASIRETDTVARFGGDEFALILEDLGRTPAEAAARAQAVAEKILAVIGEPYLLDGRTCYSTASLGITVFGDPSNTVDAILQQADIALYKAKSAGRDTARFFVPELQAAVNARAALESDLRRAIAGQQFVHYYQPQIEHGQVTGCEALIRWAHPVRGVVLPSEFIPPCEETGLILTIGAWGLQEACAQLAAWADRPERAKLTIAVNISARHFREPDFVAQVQSALQRSGANPERLRLELTESILVADVEDVIVKMNELRDQGVRFSLDDFGTGYSSLAYLAQLPLNRLKIDQAFVQNLPNVKASMAIAQTILSLGWAMELDVIAEGVETEEQRAALAGLGCDSYQGFLFSRPVPIDAFESYVDELNGPVALTAG